MFEGLSEQTSRPTTWASEPTCRQLTSKVPPCFQAQRWRGPQVWNPWGTV